MSIKSASHHPDRVRAVCDIIVGTSSANIYVRTQLGQMTDGPTINHQILLFSSESYGDYIRRIADDNDCPVEAIKDWLPEKNYCRLQAPFDHDTDFNDPFIKERLQACNLTADVQRSLSNSTGSGAGGNPAVGLGLGLLNQDEIEQAIRLVANELQQISEVRDYTPERGIEFHVWSTDFGGTARGIALLVGAIVRTQFPSHTAYPMTLHTILACVLPNPSNKQLASSYAHLQELNRAHGANGLIELPGYDPISPPFDYIIPITGEGSNGQCFDIQAIYEVEANTMASHWRPASQSVLSAKIPDMVDSTDPLDPLTQGANNCAIESAVRMRVYSPTVSQLRAAEYAKLGLELEQQSLQAFHEQGVSALDAESRHRLTEAVSRLFKEVGLNNHDGFEDSIKLTTLKTSIAETCDRTSLACSTKTMQDLQQSVPSYASAFKEKLSKPIKDKIQEVRILIREGGEKLVQAIANQATDLSGEACNRELALGRIRELHEQAKQRQERYQHQLDSSSQRLNQHLNELTSLKRGLFSRDTIAREYSRRLLTELKTNLQAKSAYRLAEAIGIALDALEQRLREQQRSYLDKMAERLRDCQQEIDARLVNLQAYRYREHRVHAFNFSIEDSFTTPDEVKAQVRQNEAGNARSITSKVKVEILNWLREHHDMPTVIDSLSHQCRPATDQSEAITERLRNDDQAYHRVAQLLHDNAPTALKESVVKTRDLNVNQRQFCSIRIPGGENSPLVERLRHDGVIGQTESITDSDDNSITVYRIIVQVPFYALNRIPDQLHREAKRYQSSMSNANVYAWRLSEPLAPLTAPNYDLYRILIIGRLVLADDIQPHHSDSGFDIAVYDKGNQRQTLDPSTFDEAIRLLAERPGLRDTLYQRLTEVIAKDPQASINMLQDALGVVVPKSPEARVINKELERMRATVGRQAA